MLVRQNLCGAGTPVRGSVGSCIRLFLDEHHRTRRRTRGFHHIRPVHPNVPGTNAFTSAPRDGHVRVRRLFLSHEVNVTPAEDWILEAPVETSGSAYNDGTCSSCSVTAR